MYRQTKAKKAKKLTETVKAGKIDVTLEDERSKGHREKVTALTDQTGLGKAGKTCLYKLTREKKII